MPTETETPRAAVTEAGGGQVPPVTVRDVVMWRRKKIGAAVLAAVTATWTILQVYQFNFVTLLSWLAMFVITSAFLWGNLQRLFNKEISDMSGLEISELKGYEMTHVIQSWMEEGVRWMFRVGAEGHPFVFAGTIAGLWVASKVSECFDFLTLVYIGIIIAMTLPAIYINYEEKFKALGERLRMQCKRLYSYIDENVLRKIKNKVSGVEKVKKEKKME